MTCLHVVFPHLIVFVHCVESEQHTLTVCEGLSNVQPVSSDLKSFGAFLDDIDTKSTPAQAGSVTIINRLINMDALSSAE